VSRCPPELLVRWAQFGCFTPLMQAHGRFEQEAWTYDRRTLDLFRAAVLLHERLVPYVRAAAPPPPAAGCRSCAR
jgi:alpha-glucosidase (family GH31 glycosyl hydrolase)